MKKTKLSIIILSVLLLLTSVTSCNTNAEEGIFYQIMNSTKDTQLKITQYLGKYNDDYYFIAQSKLYKLTDNESELIPLLYDKGIITEGYIDTDTGIFYFSYQNKNLDDDTNIFKYNLNSTGSDPEKVSGITSCRKIYENGFILTTEGYYYIGGSSPTRSGLPDIDPGTVKPLPSEFISKDSLAVSTDSYIYIIEHGSYFRIETSEKLTGFQKLGDNDYLLFINQKVYRINNSTTTISENDLKLTLDSSANAATGYCTAVQGNKVLIKRSSSFVIIDDYTAEEYTVTPTGLDYLNNLTQINPIYMDDLDSEILVATNKNGIFLININERTKRQIL